jgi:hypothetical protein
MAPTVLEDHVKVTALTFTALLLLAFAASASADTVIRCESDGGHHECRFVEPAIVGLSRQLSRAACVEGRTWGVNGNRIWVDRGCRGEFLITERREPARRESIICESDGRRRFCAADTSFGVRIARQISRNDCIEGRTWGFNNNGIWVDNGCRAEFTLGRRGGGGYGRRPEVLVCESDFGHTHRCNVDTRGGVRLTRQLSRVECIFGRTWGYNRDEIWVRDGCRAEFSVNR